MKIDGILDIENLRVSFFANDRELRAVRGVDLSVREGEVLALVGESGSGKSVTSKAVMGILPHHGRIVSGSIRYNGHELVGIGEGEMMKIRGREIAMVPQDPFLSLDPISRVGYQIAESVRGVGARERKEMAISLMREVGISNAEERYYEYPFRFSGGMRQRIAIAAALASSPRLLICDEPTTALDVTIEAQILDLIERLKDERGLSVLFITHDLGVVARIADRVAVMYAGKIVEEGMVDEVFYDPKHPYTWALMSSMPTGKGRSSSIPGSVPDLTEEIVGDAFAPRNEYSMKIDFLAEPPFFSVSDTHRVASWLYHPDAPRVEMPHRVKEKIYGFGESGSN